MSDRRQAQVPGTEAQMTEVEPTQEQLRELYYSSSLQFSHGKFENLSDITLENLTKLWKIQQRLQQERTYKTNEEN